MTRIADDDAVQDAKKPAIEDLASFLQNTPRVSLHVKQLKLASTERLPRRTQVPLYILQDILAALPALRCLRCFAPRVDVSGARSRPDFNPLRLEHLQFFHDSQFISSTLAPFFALFRSVDFLDLRGSSPYIHDAEAGTDGDFHCQNPVKVNRVSINLTPHPPLATWARILQTFMDASSVHSLEMSTSSWDKKPLFATSLTRIFTNIQRLELVSSKHRNFHYPLDLSCCPRLQSLCITVLIPWEYFSALKFRSNTWSSMMQTVSGAPSTLQDIRLTFLLRHRVVSRDRNAHDGEFSEKCASILKRLDAVDWSLLGRAVEGRRALKEIRVDVVLANHDSPLPPQFCSDTETLFRARYSKDARAQNIMRFSVTAQRDLI